MISVSPKNIMSWGGATAVQVLGFSYFQWTEQLLMGEGPIELLFLCVLAGITAAPLLFERSWQAIFSVALVAWVMSGVGVHWFISNASSAPENAILITPVIMTIYWFSAALIGLVHRYTPLRYWWLGGFLGFIPIGIFSLGDPLAWLFLLWNIFVLVTVVVLGLRK